jgi:hypothetical protein
MQQIISSGNIQTIFAPNTYAQTREAKAGFFSKFIDWCNHQEEKRFLWLAISLFGNIGMVLPVTLLSILFFADNNFTLWIVACAVNVPVLALNLAAQPPKVTLPTMFISLVIDTVIIILCIGMFMLI